MAEYLFNAGRWDEALAELTPAFEPGAEVGELPLLTCRGLGARIAVSRDDQAALEAHLAAAGDYSDVSGLHHALVANLGKARALEAERAGRPAEAVAILAPAADPASDMSTDVRLWWCGDLVRCAISAGDRHTASAVARYCEELARQAKQDRPSAEAMAGRCHGLAETDATALAQAAARYGELRLPYDQALALEDLAVVRGMLGDVAEARAALREAVEVYAGLGAEWDIRRADARAREHGVRRRRRAGIQRPATGWEALSPTEQKIAFLLADRLSNRDIAARMYLSWHTVRFYLSSIMAKLEVHSRVEVAQEAVRHPDPGGHATRHPA